MKLIVPFVVGVVIGACGPWAWSWIEYLGWGKRQQEKAGRKWGLD